MMVVLAFALLLGNHIAFRRGWHWAPCWALTIASIICWWPAVLIVAGGSALVALGDAR